MARVHDEKVAVMRGKIKALFLLGVRSDTLDVTLDGWGFVETTPIFEMNVPWIVLGKANL